MQVDLESSRESIEYARPETVRPPLNRLGVFAVVFGALASVCVALAIILGGGYFFFDASLGFGVVGAMAGSMALFMGRARASSVSFRRRGNGLGLFGILLASAPLVAVATASIWQPGCSIGGPASKIAKCASNLRQIGQAAQLYANENGGRLPDDFAMMLMTQDMVPAIFDCPSTNDTPAVLGATTQATAANLKLAGHCSYVYLGTYWMDDELTANVVLAYEPLNNHANAGMNVLYGDGHVDWVDWRGANWILSELKAGRNPPRAMGAATTQPTRGGL